MSDSSAVQAEIVEEFEFFSDWMERYQYLIDLGRQLPEFPEAAKIEENRLHGCQSQVWLTVSGSTERLEFAATSDSAIVCGLIALVLRVYSGNSAQAILGIEPTFIEAIGLTQHLSPTRSNGLHAMLEAIRLHAAIVLEAGSVT